MSIDEVVEVCRLCLKNENLVWVFDKRFENTENMKDVIFITTGVEIELKDVVSQKICKKCLQIAIKIFQFRGTSLKNDTFLKNKYKELVTGKPSTSIKGESSHQKTDIEQTTKHELIHPSVKAIMNKHPRLVLPKSCLHINIAPYVAMPMNEVENYFKKRNLNMQKYIFYALQALRSYNKSGEIKVKTESKLCLSTSENAYKDTKQISTTPAIDTKLTNNYKADYSNIKKEKISSYFKKTFSSSDSTPDCANSSTSKKRRISESSSTISSLGSTPPPPKKSKTDSEGPVQVSSHEKTLEICNICNSVQYSLKDLKRHQLKHLLCQFCKSKFKTMERKNEHIKKDCFIRKIMNSLPNIDLIKIEFDLYARQTYPKAFTDFPPIPGLNVKTDDKMNNDVLENSAVVRHVTAENSNNTNNSDIIEILSDDDEPGKTSSKDTEKQPDVSNSSVVTTVNSTSTLSTGNSSIPLQQNALPVSSTGTSEHQPSIENIDVIPAQSSSIVKPDIKIKNNYILETIDPKDSDMKILKDLLKNYRKLKLSKDAAVQPEVPSNTSIINSQNELSTKLKDLKHHLQIYRIPVEIKHGIYRVSFDYSPKPKKTKKMASWNNLNPVDIKKHSNQTNPRQVNNNPVNPLVVTSTSTLSGYTGPSVSQGITVSAPLPPPLAYNSVHLPTTTNTISSNSNQTPTISYHQNNTVLAQIVYQPNSRSMLVNQSNNFISYNPNNALYNASASVIIPNSVPQVLVPSTPVFASNSIFTPNPVASLSTSALPSLPQSSQAYGINPSTVIQSSNSIPTTTTTLSAPVSSTNSVENSLFVPNGLFNKTTVTSAAPSTAMDCATKTIPLIRVKDLQSLK